MLEEFGYSIDEANNGVMALTKIQERIELVREEQAEMYKIILLDYSMPDLDGPQTARRI